MSSQKTERYQLHKWEPGDDFLRAEFNENFTKLDAAAHIVTGAYIGDGAEERVIDLGFTPAAVLVLYRGGELVSGRYYYGGLAVTGHPATTIAGNTVEVAAGGFKVFYRQGNYNLNSNGTIYYNYIAIR